MTKQQIKQETMNCINCKCGFLQGWFAYADHADTHNLKRRISQALEDRFPGYISSFEIDKIIKEAEV